MENIDPMDFEEQKKRRKKKQRRKVILVELSMVLAVIVIVVIALLATMGFSLRSDGSVEQSGLMQIHTLPTGASVELDGETLFFRTNLSRTMPAGDHYLRLSKDGYDSWEKTVTMYPGILIRLYYPRLFLLDREPEKVIDLGKELSLYSVSDDHTAILYAEEKATKWKMLNIKGDEVTEESTLDLAEVLPGVKESKFEGKIESTKWSANSDHVLTKVSYEGSTEWILIDLRDPKASLNLTKSFGLNFEKILIADGSAGKLFALENKQVRRINTYDQAMSRVLLNNVVDFGNSGSNLVYVTSAVASATDGDGTKKQKVGVYRDGEKSGTTIATIPESDRVKAALSSYFDDIYVSIVVNDRMTIYYGELPAYSEEQDGSGVDNMEKLVDNKRLQSVPEKLSTSPAGEYVVAQNGQIFMVIDLETGVAHEYDSGTVALKWLDDSMMYSTSGDELAVWDFDGTNRRVLVSKQNQQSDDTQNNTDNQAKKNQIEALASRQVAIASNNKWLYYVVETSSGYRLMREKVRD